MPPVTSAAPAALSVGELSLIGFNEMVTTVSSSSLTPSLTVYSAVVSNNSTVVSEVDTNVASPSDLIVIAPITTPSSERSTGTPTSPASPFTSLTVKVSAGTSASESFVSTLKTTVLSSSTFAVSETPTGAESLTALRSIFIVAVSTAVGPPSSVTDTVRVRAKVVVVSKSN